MDAKAFTEIGHKRDSSGKLMVKSPECQARELGARPEGSKELRSSRGGTGQM